MSIYRVFFMNEAGHLYADTGYDGVGETAVEAAVRLAIINEIPIEYTHSIRSMHQVEAGEIVRSQICVGPLIGQTIGSDLRLK